MADIGLLEEYFKNELAKLERGGGEPHKEWLIKDKLKNIKYWVGTAWGMSVIKRLKEKTNG